MTTDPQKSVDAMALAIGSAETLVEDCILAVDKLNLPTEVRAFHYAVETHVSYTGEIQASLGEAAMHMGKALAAMGEAHKKLDGIRRAKKLPEPGPVPLNGGGGGKP